MSKKNDDVSNLPGRKKRVANSKDISAAIANRIYSLVEQRKLPQAEIAQKTGVSRTAISAAINRGNLSLPTAMALSRFLNVSLDYLCCLTDIDSPAAMALDYLESQIVLSEKKTEKKSAYFSAKISKPMADYLDALKSVGPREDVKEYYIRATKKDLLAAIANQTKQTNQSMKQYIIFEYAYDRLPRELEDIINEFDEENTSKL